MAAVAPGLDATPRRLGLVDLAAAELPFALRLAERLRTQFDLRFFQPRADTRALFGPQQARLWSAPPAAPLDCSDADLIEACGAHERHWASSPELLLRRARPLAGTLAAFVATLDALLVFNGAPLPRALAVYLARRRGIPVLHAENGYLPGTMQLDPGGVNHDSSHTARIAAGDYRRSAYDATALDRSLRALRRGEALPGTEPFAPARPPLLARLQREWRRLAETPPQPHWPAAFSGAHCHPHLPAYVGPFVLLPLQVRHDAQLSTHSPLVGDDLTMLIELTRGAVNAALPRHRLVVKLHPKESRRERARLLHLAARLPDVLFIEQQPIHELLPHCTAVVTINSTVGVEALAFGKPVITLGRSFYSVAPLVHPVTQFDALPGTLRAAIAAPPDALLTRRFLGYLQQHMLVQGDYRDGSQSSLRAIEARIRQLLDVPAALP